MKTFKPVYNKSWQRWEVPDEDCDAMRGLTYEDLKDMADNYIYSRGFEPGLHEDWSDALVKKYQKKYKITTPLPEWAINFIKEYSDAHDVCRPDPQSVEKMIRKHASSLI